MNRLAAPCLEFLNMHRVPSLFHAMSIAARVAMSAIVGFVAIPAIAQQTAPASGQAPASPAQAAPQAAPSAAPLPGARRRDRDKVVVDPDLRMGIGITSGRLRAGGFTDESGKVSGLVLGNPMRHNIGPSSGFKFNGKTDLLLIGDPVDPAKPSPGLPTRDMTITMWVAAHELAADRTIIGCMGADSQGSSMGGWRVGADNDQFFFELAAKGESGSAKPATRIKSTTKIQPDRWYHVVASFDGRSMKLYVNAQMQAESKDQTGTLAYPAGAIYAVAASELGGQRSYWSGTVLETKVYARVYTQQAISEEYAPGTRLTAYEPVLEATQRFVVRPMLQMATRDGITVVWETARPGKGIVEYGRQLPYTERVEGSNDQLHKVRITGLQPETNYFYRVRTIEPDGKEIVSDDLTFQTAINPETPFAFSVIGDTQNNKPVIEKLQAFTFTLRPSFQIHVGDVVDRGPDKSEWTDEMLAGSYPVMSRCVMYPAIGNHEENHSLYYRYFDLPAPQAWYTYTWGNAQMFSVDTNKAIDPSSEQYKWLESELAKSTATWKFVYHHHPVYSSDEDDYGNLYKGASSYGDTRLRHLADLYEKHKVDINFCGHIHSYERSWPIFQGKIDQAKGVRYVTSGGGGGGLESAGPVRTWFAQRVYRGHHVGFVMIHDKTLEYQVFDLEGRLIDSWGIRK
jgi:acid phosphatase type 7